MLLTDIILMYFSYNLTVNNRLYAFGTKIKNDQVELASIFYIRSYYLTVKGGYI